MSESPWTAGKRMDACRADADVVGYLRARADWLKAEWQAGGSYEGLKPKYDECVYLASLFAGWNLVQAT